jgi:hypothetical protein
MIPSPRVRTFACVAALAAVNLLVIAKLFRVEFLAYNLSIEGTFIALARLMAKYPGETGWWPFWNCGLPFENAYLPFSHWVVALFSTWSGLSAARSFHVVTALWFALGPGAVFAFALEFSRKRMASFLAALLYSCFSFSNLLVPALAADSGGILNLRRLYVVVYWGETPHTVALTLLPLALIAFSRALTTEKWQWKIASGLLAALVGLSNAFGGVALGLGLVCWLAAYAPAAPWKALRTVAAIGAVSYAFVSPWVSPGLLRAIRENSPTSGGDFRYRPASWVALAAILGGFVLLAWWLRRRNTAPHLRFFLLCSFVPVSVVAVWYAWGVPVIAQPYRFHLQMDLFLPLVAVFGVAALLESAPRQWRVATAAAALAVVAIQCGATVRYARQLIQPADTLRLSEYRIAQWLDANRPGERTFVPGSVSLFLNAFTDTPQIHGGHDQHTVNPFVPIVSFTIYSDMNAGDRAAEYSVFWLKAFGARTIAVTTAGSTEFYKPYAHPAKFDGVLPLLWREGGDSIYEVPARSASLAHVVPRSAVVARRPIHGLDTAPAEAYVAALDNPVLPAASFAWASLREAQIRAHVTQEHLVAVQVTYAPGWEAWANGKSARVRGDGLGLTVIEPDCRGACEITMRYTGGRDSAVTRSASAAALLGTILYALLRWRRAASGRLAAS